PDQLWPVDRGGIYRDLIGASPEHRPGVFHGADAPADGEGDEDLIGGPLDDVDHGCAVVGAGGDVQKNQLVGALGVIKGGELDRIAGVAQLNELDPLDDPASGDVQTGNNASREHGVPLRYRWRS